jgi:hypothetical protein
MKLTPEMVATLLKIVRGENPNLQDKLLILQLIQKSENDNLTREEYLEFVKTFFRLAPLLKVLLE